MPSWATPIWMVVRGDDRLGRMLNTASFGTNRKVVKSTGSTQRPLLPWPIPAECRSLLQEVGRNWLLMNELDRPTCEL